MKFERQNIPIKFKILILAFFYFLVGYLSLKLAIFPGGITPIFFASGVAFVGVYFWGNRVWPGIVLGSIGVDYAVWIMASDTGSFHPSLVSIGISVGASLQAVFAVWSFKKFCDPSQFLNKAQNILWFIALPAGIGCLISPLWGTLTIYFSGYGDWNQFGIFISSGWFAESAGILLIIPLVWVTLINKSSIDFPNKINFFEYFIFVLSLFIAGQIVFGKVIGNPHYPLVYSLFPFLVWAVFRFGVGATLITSLAICCFSIWGSLNQGGPFVGRSNFETLLLLQAYCWFVTVTALVAIGEVTERVISEKKLKESNQLLDSIREIQSEFMSEIQPKILFDDLLKKFIHLTQSQFGFIGEILHSNDGSPYLKTYSISNIAWDETTRQFYDDNFESGFEFNNMDSLFGAAILKEETVIANSPKEDSRSGGLPAGHPELNSFLGIPIHVGKQLIGMVGLANREEGYREEMVKFLEPLISTSGQLILKFRKETERLEIEKQLGLEKEKLKSIADKLPVLIAYVDSEMRYQFNNKAYFDWMGLDPQELHGKKVEEVLGEKGFLSIKPYIESVLKGEPQYYETRLPHPKRDELRYIAASYIPHKNSKGEIEGYTALIQDLTDRKRAEEEIAERERQLKSILDNTPTILYMKDMQGRYLLINKKCEEVIGIKNEEIIGKTTRDIFPKEVAEKFLKHDQLVMNGLMPNEVEEMIPYGDGFKTVLSVQFPLRNDDGTPYGICGISTDITERKVAEKKLQDYKDQLENIIQERTKELTEANQKLNEITTKLQISEERAKFAIEATTDGYWDWNLETNEVFFSDTWSESLGYIPGELKPDIDTWQSKVHPKDMHKVKEALDDHLNEKTPFYQCENRLLTKSGTWRWNLDRGKVVKRDSRGTPLRMVGTDTDITERKLAEEELKKSQDQVMHMEKLSALGKLTGSIAHEFNNPIYGTKIILEQLREEANLSEQQDKGLSLAIKECYRMADLIAKLRDFYQPTSKKRESVDIHDLLFDVLLLMKNKFKEKKISVVNELAEGLPRAVVVGDQIKQVFLNLIQNAEDSFLNPSSKNKITIKTEFRNNNIYIKIKDNGIGISEEHIKNIFDPFYTTKPAVKGTGLGLSISHGIIKDHGGSIDVKSKFGKGSTFSIKLSIKDAENEKS